MFLVQILVDICSFYKTMQMNCLKSGLDHTEFCAHHQVRGPQIVQTFSQRVEPQTDNLLALFGHIHIDNMYYLKELCMFPVLFVSICRFL